MPPSRFACEAVLASTVSQVDVSVVLASTVSQMDASVVLASIVSQVDAKTAEALEAQRRAEDIQARMAPKDPLDHYAVQSPEECSCVICRDVLARQGSLTIASIATQRNDCDCPACHPRRLAKRPGHAVNRNYRDKDAVSCACMKCRIRKNAQHMLLVATAKRDLWIEMSFHAAFDPELGVDCMEWLSREIHGDKHTDRFWANDAFSRSMGYWLQLYRQYNPVVVVKLYSSRMADSIAYAASMQDCRASFLSDDTIFDLHMALFTRNSNRRPKLALSRR